VDSEQIMGSTLTISVVGLGYVGLPTALAFHDLGIEVRGIDTSERVVNMLVNGKNPIVDVTEHLEIPVDSPRWSVSSSFAGQIETSDVVVITVPTPTDNDLSPDLSYVKSAFRSILSNIDSKKGTIVVLESTVSPGTTRSTSKKIASEFGITSGVDFHLAYSPERVSPGEAGRTVADVARIIGCDDPLIGKRLVELYSSISSGECEYVDSIEIAEAAKMIENVQRDIDIAFVNELATILPQMGLDVEEVLEAASSKWSFHRHNPGIGVGGHCIPVDPYYYIDASRRLGVPSLLGPIAREINEAMPHLSARMILKSIEEVKGPRALILGYSYKPEVGDIRMTPVLQLASDLHGSGVEVAIWDPHVEPDKFPDWVITVQDPYALKEVDAIILATAHNKCLELAWEKLLDSSRTRVFFDGRRVLSKRKMEAIGWNYMGVGLPQ